MFELESHTKHPLILSASCKKLETWQLPVSRADVNIYIMYMRGTSHVSGSPVLLFFCWWYSLLESHWICGSNEFSNYGYVSVDIRKKSKVWFKYRDMYCSCTDPERFVRGGPTLTKVFELMRGSKYHYQRAIIGPPAKSHLMPFHWRADECTKLNAGLIDLRFFRESGPALLRNPIFL